MSKTIKGYGVVVPFKEFGLIEGAKFPIAGPFDVIAEPVALAACTSDPHQVEAGLPTGLILGHEAVGRIVEVGSMVKDYKVGDVVAVGAVTPDWFTLEQQDNIHQHGGGQNFGMNWCVHENGTFAEYFRIRQVDMNAALIPKGLTYEHALMAADMVTTGFHGAELAQVGFGDTVVACGIGPVGLMAVAGAALRGAGRIIGIGRRNGTMEMAKEYGATDIVDYTKGPIDEQVLDLLGGKQPDCIIYSGGTAESFALCVKMVKPNGIVTNLQGQMYDTAIPAGYSASWCSHKQINGGLCPGGRRRLERLFAVMESGRLDPTKMITHRFTGFDGILEAYNLIAIHEKPHDFIKPVVTF
jgi:threonine dehydrogenase-like Zn-dependent dehydrogenase